MKREATLALILTAAAITVIAVGVSGSAASGSSSTRAKTIHLTLRHDGAFKQIDQPPAGRSAGDENLFTGSIHRHGKKRGELQGSCVNVTAQRVECTESVRLGGGQLALQAGFGKGNRGFAAIVGGTGAYANARGDVAERPAGPTKERWTVHLID
jgi:hypothetical protein